MSPNNAQYESGLRVANVMRRTTNTTSITTVIDTETSTIYSHYTPMVASMAKRSLPTPAVLSKLAATQVSQVCSCLSIKPSSTTSTTTVVSTAAGSVRNLPCRTPSVN